MKATLEKREIVRGNLKLTVWPSCSGHDCACVIIEQDGSGVFAGALPKILIEFIGEESKEKEL